MKKIISYLMIAFIAINITSCKKDEVEENKVVDLKLSEKSPLLMVTEEKKDITITGGDGEKYSAVTSDDKVVTVSVKKNKMTVRAVKEGTAKITVKSSYKKVVLDVTVSNKVVDLVLSEQQSLILFTTETKTITVSGGDGKDYTAESSDPEVATVSIKDKEITVTAIKEGNVTVTVKSADKKATLGIKVTDKVVDLVLSEQSSLALFTTDTKTITVSGGNGKDYTAESSDPAVASVSIENKVMTVKAIKAGNVTITVKSADREATLGVKITDKVVDLVLSEQSDLDLFTTDTKNITVSGGNGKDYTVESSDSAIATVSINDKNIVVTAKKAGTAKITVKSAGKEISLDVKVKLAIEEPGVYNLDGTPVFEVKSTIKEGDKTFSIFSDHSPYQGKLVKIKLIDTPSKGASQAVEIEKVRDVSNLLEGPETTVVERVTEKTIQLKSSNFIFVLPKK